MHLFPLLVLHAKSRAGGGGGQKTKGNWATSSDALLQEPSAPCTVAGSNSDLPSPAHHSSTTVITERYAVSSPECLPPAPLRCASSAQQPRFAFSNCCRDPRSPFNPPPLRNKMSESRTDVWHGAETLAIAFDIGTTQCEPRVAPEPARPLTLLSDDSGSQRRASHSKPAHPRPCRQQVSLSQPNRAPPGYG